MRHVLCLLLLLGGLSGFGFGYGRSGDLADPSFLNAGDTGAGISVSVSSTAVSQVYFTTTTPVVDREILLQNPNDTYLIYCGTHSAVSASAGSRFFIPSRGSFTTNGIYDIWCIGEAGASPIEMLGIIEFDGKD